MMVVALALLVAGSTATLKAKGKDVTFHNRSDTVQHVLARFGGGGSCKERPQKEQLTLQKGERVVLESGEEDVCWCSSSAGKIGDCGDTWKKAKPGSFKRILS